jgi:hypothetical protein
MESSCSSNPHAGLTAASAARNYSPLVQFSYLQLLDLLTTAAFLAAGVREANPLVRVAMAVAPSPFGALLALKMFTLAAAAFCARSGRARVLVRMNVLFAALVVWNLIALLGR